MIAVITGDIINSRQVSPEIWMPVLKDVLNEFGTEPKQWEIFRGDSFELEIPNPETAFEVAMTIKASIKTIKKLDIRLGIGVGEKDYNAEQIRESNGTAFVRSGSAFERLSEDKIELAIQTPWADFNEAFNAYFLLALIPMNRWTKNAAEIVRMALLHKELAQKELGTKLNIKQNTVSERLSRSHLSELLTFDTIFRKKLTNKMKKM